MATIQSIRTGLVPPTINLDDPDEEGLGLDLAAKALERRDIRVALNNSFGFGGKNATLVFRRWEA
jgi:3-oxoacyl-[acyl-carrier-protein] synthase II